MTPSGLPLYNPEADLSLFSNLAFRPTGLQRLGLVGVAVGLAACVVALASGLGAAYPLAFGVTALLGLGGGGVLYALGGLSMWSAS